MIWNWFNKYGSSICWNTPQPFKILWMNIYWHRKLFTKLSVKKSNMGDKISCVHPGGWCDMAKVCPVPVSPQPRSPNSWLCVCSLASRSRCPLSSASWRLECQMSNDKALLSPLPPFYSPNEVQFCHSKRCSHLCEWYRIFSGKSGDLSVLLTLLSSDLCRPVIQKMEQNGMGSPSHNQVYFFIYLDSIWSILMKICIALFMNLWFSLLLVFLDWLY